MLGACFKKEANLSKAKQLKERTPRAFCHSDISNMQMRVAPTPESRKARSNDTLGKQVGVLGSFAFPRSNLLYIRCSFPSEKIHAVSTEVAMFITGWLTAKEIYEHQTHNTKGPKFDPSNKTQNGSLRLAVYADTKCRPCI